MKNKNFLIKITDFLPETTKIFIPFEQGRIVRECIIKFTTEQKLANYLGISRSRVNDWKFERSRINLNYFIKMKEILKEEIPEEFQFQTHKRNSLKISKFEITPKISWLIGIRDGDKDEDEYSIGVGTSDPEIAIEFIEILRSCFKVETNELWCQITIPKYEINGMEKMKTKNEYSKILGIPQEIIRVYPKDKSGKHKKHHITVRYFNKLVKTLFNSFENWFKNNILSFDEYVQGGYVKGLIDSEGTIRDCKRIAIEMRPTPIFQLTSEILNNLSIENRFYERKNRNLCGIVIYGPLEKVMKFCCPIHKNKRNKIICGIQHSGLRARVPQQRLTQRKE